MKYPRSRTRATSIKLSDALDQRLTELAQRHRTTRSAIVREALEQYEARGASLSFAAAAADLDGAVKGPKDLATSRRHMLGYGR
jgi:predicted transcriptional regulator